LIDNDGIFAGPVLLFADCYSLSQPRLYSTRWSVLDSEQTSSGLYSPSDIGLPLWMAFPAGHRHSRRPSVGSTLGLLSFPVPCPYHGPNSCNGCRMVDHAVVRMLMMCLSIQTNLRELQGVSENSGQSEPGPIRTLASPYSCDAPLRVTSPCIWHWGVSMHSGVGAGPGQRLEGPTEQLRAYKRCLGGFRGFPGRRLAGSRTSAVSGFSRWWRRPRRPGEVRAGLCRQVQMVGRTDTIEMTGEAV